MNEELKKKISAKYQQALQRGERFWPDSIYKDLLVSFALFIVLVLLATFVGVPGEPKADPSDASYVPRPEWYFLFLFKFLALYGQLAYIGKIEWLAAILIPVVVLLVLLLLPILDKNPKRHYSGRILALTVMAIFVLSVIVLTLLANIPLTSDEAGKMILPSVLQFWAGLLLPGMAYVLLVGLSFLGRKFGQVIGRAQLWTTGVAAFAMLGLTGAVLVLSPPVAAEQAAIANTLPEQILAGQDLYLINCVECHGDDGTTTVISGVEGLDGTAISPIHSQDVMYTFTDDTLFNIINYGQQGLGMTPFGKAYGGELGPGDISNIVTFMRYSWDDRVEMPEQAAVGIPPLAEGEVPSYEVHVQPLVKRYCYSCHRPGKTNNNYLMTTYEEILTTGDNVDNDVIAGDPNSYIILVINGTEITDPASGEVLIHQMPQTKLMKAEYIDMLTRWVLAGMPLTAQDAQLLIPDLTPTP